MKFVVIFEVEIKEEDLPPSKERDKLVLAALKQKAASLKYGDFDYDIEDDD